MSSKPPIGYIDIRVFAHATEDTRQSPNSRTKPIARRTGRNPYFPKNKFNGASWKPHHSFYSPINRQKTASSSTAKNWLRLKLA